MSEKTPQGGKKRMTFERYLEEGMGWFQAVSEGKASKPREQPVHRLWVCKFMTHSENGELSCRTRVEPAQVGQRKRT